MNSLLGVSESGLLSHEPLYRVTWLGPNADPVVNPFALEAYLPTLITVCRIVRPEFLDYLAVARTPPIHRGDSVNRFVPAPDSLQSDPYSHNILRGPGVD